MKVKIGAVVAALFFAAPALSATWTNGLQVVDNIIWIPGYHGFYVKAGTYHDPQNCTTSNRLYLMHPTIEQDVVTANRLFALITLAMANGKTVYIYLDGCSGAPTNNVPYITGIQVND